MIKNGGHPTVEATEAQSHLLPSLAAILELSQGRRVSLSLGVGERE